MVTDRKYVTLQNATNAIRNPFHRIVVCCISLLCIQIPSQLNIVAYGIEINRHLPSSSFVPYDFTQ